MIYLDSMGHLFSDQDVDELYDFAVNKMGLKPEWNHYSRNLPHFDITTARKKKQARELGAVYLEDLRDALDMYRKVKPLYPSSRELALPYVEGVGLIGQKILRVDFKKYFELKEPSVGIDDDFDSDWELHKD